MNAAPPYTLDFYQINMDDVARVGGKNASLGQMFNELKPQGVGVLDGFATTADAYWLLLSERNLKTGWVRFFPALTPKMWVSWRCAVARRVRR